MRRRIGSWVVDNVARRRFCRSCRAVPVDTAGMVCSPACWEAADRAA